MDEPDAALNVIERVTWECSPWYLRGEKAKPGPCIDSDAAVLQLSDNLVPLIADRTARCRVDDNVCAERSMQLLVAVGDRISEVVFSVVPADAGYAEHRRKYFLRFEEMLFAECLPSARPVFFKRDDEESFHVRMGNATQALKTSESLAYIEQQFSASPEIHSSHEPRNTDDGLRSGMGDARESQSPLSEWLEELKQRRVIRTAILYIVVAWSLTEIATTAAETLDAPSWLGRVIMLGFIGGFPVAMLLAWLYDLRITRAEDSESSSSKARSLWLLGVLAAALALVIASKVLLGSG